MLKTIPLFLIASLCLLFTQNVYAQTDTTKHKVNTKPQTYLQFYYSLTNTPGTWGGKSNLSIEVGKQWDVFSVGVDLGKSTLDRQGNRDTSLYFEVRPNLNIFQQGRFTNTLTIGIGYVFGADDNFLTELTSGIEYSATDRLHLNVNFGQFYYSGRYTASNATFFGASVSYYFTPYKRRSSIFRPR